MIKTRLGPSLDEIIEAAGRLLKERVRSRLTEAGRLIVAEEVAAVLDTLSIVDSRQPDGKVVEINIIIKEVSDAVAAAK